MIANNDIYLHFLPKKSQKNKKSQISNNIFHAVVTRYSWYNYYRSSSKQLQYRKEKVMKNTLSGMKKHNRLLSSLSSLAALVLLTSSFIGACYLKKKHTPEELLSKTVFVSKRESHADTSSSVFDSTESSSGKVYINNKDSSVEIFNREGEILISLEGILTICRPTCKISKTDVFFASDTNFELTADKRKNYITANGRYLWCNGGIASNKDSIFVTPRLAAEVISATYEAKDSNIFFTVPDNCSYLENGESYYNSEDVYWLSRIICAESRGEVLEGKIAVGNVVLNRLVSEEYPNTIRDVIFDDAFGVQFSPASNGSIYNEPTEESIIAAKLCLEGVSVSSEILYFLNPKTADNFWVPENRTYITTIGNHAFYS